MPTNAPTFRRLPFAVLLLGTILSASLALFMQSRIDAEAASEFEHHTDRLSQVITRQFREPLQGLRGLAASYDAVGPLSRAQFKRYVESRDLRRNFPAVRGFGFIQRVARDQLSTFIAEQRADGDPRFEVRYLGIGNLERLYVIELLEPPGPPGILGLDLGSEPQRRATIEQAIATGQPTLSPRLTLRVDREEQRAGFLLYLPVFRHDADPTTPDQRHAALVGLLFAPIVIADALGDLAHGEADQVAFELLDPQAATPARRVYDSQRATSPDAGAQARLHEASRFHATRLLALPGRELSLQVYSQPGIERRIERWIPALVLAIGTLLTVLVALWTSRQRTARRAAERLAQAMTAELERLALVARLTSNGVVITDENRLITWVNEPFERLSGYTNAELLGQKAGKNLQFDGTDPWVLGQLRAALDAGQGFHCELRNRAKTGRTYWVDIEIQPLRDAAGKLTGFMAIESDITARKQAEAQLLASQAMLDKSERIGGVGGWALDMQTLTFQVTDQGCRILDRPLGHRPTLAQVLAQFAPPAQATIRQILLQDWTGVIQQDVELPMTTIKGRQIWVRLVAEREYADGGVRRIVGVLQDITESLRAAAEVQRSAALLRGAMDALDEAFVLYDPDDRLVFCNQKYRDLYQISRDLIVPGVRFEEILRSCAQAGQFPDAEGRVDDWVAACIRKHRTGNVTRIQQVSDGRVLRIIDRRMPDGHTVGFRVDLTDMAQAKNAAERAHEAQANFIATMSHELRTPLQTITGFSDLGKFFAQDDARYLAMFTDIHDGGMRMLKLVNGLLDISKIDGNADAVSLKPGDLAAQAAAVVHELRPLAERRALRVLLPEPLPRLAALVDDFRIQQVVRNLLANALRFAPDGSAIEIGCADHGADGVECWVRDHGPGIPPDELESIFEAFVQSSRTRDGSGGTGLGLTISRTIVRAHGGQLSAANAQGGGAVFSIRLPAAAGPPGRPAARPEHPTCATERNEALETT